MSTVQTLLNKLIDKKASLDDILNTDVVKKYFLFSDPIIEILTSFGLPINTCGDFYSLTTTETKISDQVFCFVDIETNGSNPSKSQIIEIAAVKSRGVEIIDKFDTMVHCCSISDTIAEITGIKASDLLDKPSELDVMNSFRVFLGDAVFVAHNVDFDFSFISSSMEKYDLPPLLNRRLCTIDLAKKTIEAEKYGLKYLAEMLKLEGFLHHRAYSDAIASYEVFKKSKEFVPADIVTTEELISFSLKNVGKKVVEC